MRSLIVVLALLFVAPAFACDGNRCGCPTDQTEVVPAEELNIDNITFVACEDMKTLTLTCVESTNRVGRILMHDCTGLQNAIEFLKDNEVSDEALQPLIDVQTAVSDTLADSWITFQTGALYYNLAQMLAETDSPANRLKAALYYAEAYEAAESARAALVCAQEQIEGVRETAQTLFDSLENDA